MYRILELCRFFIAQRTSLKIPILYFDIQICFFTDWGPSKSNQRGREESWWKAINSGNITSIRVWARWAEKISLIEQICMFVFFHFQLLCQLQGSQHWGFENPSNIVRSVGRLKKSEVLPWSQKNVMMRVGEKLEF